MNSWEFRVLIMPRKNKPQNHLTFCANANPGTKCEKRKKRGMKCQKSGAKYPAIYFVWKWVRHAKNEKCIAGISHHFFHVSRHFFLFSHFRSILCQDWHSCKKSKDFTVYFFVALIKHEIHMKCETCIKSVLYFKVRFAKALTKCEKCIAGLIL